MWKRFLLLHSIATLLLLSWLLPVTRPLWDMCDRATFLFLNGQLEESPLQQIFWALANVKICDLFGAFFMAFFFFVYISDAEKPYRHERIAQFLFVCLFGELGILFTKQLLGPFLEAYNLMRDGPTSTYTNSIFLSDAIPWLKVKDHANFSFPSDHAAITMQWLGFVFLFCGRRYGLMALPWVVFFILPRLISGAHWLSDALVGSLSITLVILAWARFSPIYSYVMPRLTAVTQRIFYAQPKPV